MNSRLTKNIQGFSWNELKCVSQNEKTNSTNLKSKGTLEGRHFKVAQMKGFNISMNIMRCRK